MPPGGDRYGRPNLWKDLPEDGEAVSEKRVARLMREEDPTEESADDSRARR